MENSNPKSVLVDAIKKSTNILVTVSHNPSTDALAAALGFSLMLNKLDKHATAVFSGAIPPAIQFLEPQKTFESSVSSLRDFIIALDKEKADRLRYKVEGDVVRIYITPYKTTITQADLDFSEGEFNVDLVIALGVEKQSDLDNAISAHGRILHDAIVATVNIDNVKSTLGSVDWSDEKASSLCEMLMSLSEALQSNLLDEQIATALLTGIVAATDRFSNKHTSPRVMTMSAQLMAAGANQQLIAEKLEEGGYTPPTPADGTKPLSEGQSTAIEQPKQSVADGEMQVKHDDDIKDAVADAEQFAEEATEDRQEAANAKLEQALGHVTPPTPASVLASDLAAATREETSKDWRHQSTQPMTTDDEPMFSGTLNATATEAEEAKRAEERSNRNHTLLHHDSPTEQSTFGLPPVDDEPENVDPFVSSQPPHNVDSLTKGKTIQPVTMEPIKTSDLPLETMPAQPATFSPFPTTPDELPVVSTNAPAHDTGLSYEESPMPEISQPVPNQTLADLEAEVHAAASALPTTNSIDDAREAVTSAFGSQPLSVGGQTTLPNMHTKPQVEQVPIPDSPLAQPPLPPMPDFSTLPPLPPMPGQFDTPQSPHPGAIPQQPQAPAPSAPVPGQFRIPGQ
ncbi:MAG: hypothetical protein ABIQ64_00815 [Candidatus Saccharimonadales bacterium]